jgi:hypothetical protein
MKGKQEGDNTSPDIVRQRCMRNRLYISWMQSRITEVPDATINTQQQMPDIHATTNGRHAANGCLPSTSSCT